MVWTLVVTATGAQGRSNGIAGYSGEDGFACDTCHSGGTAPDVSFEGPTTVAAGQTALFRFVVRTNNPEQLAAGFDVSATAGTLGTLPSSGAKTQPFSGEIEVTHTQPRDNDETGEASWPFTWEAPQALGEETLFGAGNSVDGFGDQGGDELAATILEVEVRCAGDCSDNEIVTVDELVRGIDVALGREPLESCPLVDGNADGVVSISDLVATVDSAVNGCP
jgi:hypothetical protein